MISIEHNRSAYMTHLEGVGLLVDGGVSPVEVSKVDWRADSFGKTLVEVGDDRVLPSKKRHANYADLPNVLMEPPWDFIAVSHEIPRLANPIKTIIEWTAFLKPFGHLCICHPFAEHTPDRHRPPTALSHVIDDYRKGTRAACDEHKLAFAWAWNPATFPNPDEILVVLEDMWRRGILDMDSQSHSLVRSKGNRDRISELLSGDNGGSINHHVLDIPTILEIIAWVNKNSKACLVPIDLGLSKGYVSEAVLVLQKFPSDFAHSAAGLSVIKSQTNIFARVMHGEVWLAQEVDMLKALLA